jgi:DNA-binding NtrC family response regulator
VAKPTKRTPKTPSVSFRPLRERIRKVESQAIDEALKLTRGNKNAAAQLLRVSRTALYDKLRVLGMSWWLPKRLQPARRSKAAAKKASASRR